MLIHAWYIQLLCNLAARRNGSQVSRFQTQKTAELLAYLAFYSSQNHERDVVMEVLWPNVDPEQGRNRLKQALSSLRRQLEPPGTPSGAVLVATRIRIQINPAAVETDVRAYQSALRSADRAQNFDDKSRFLQNAAQLYKGPLFPESNSDWVLRERARLEELHQNALGRLSSLAEARGDIPQAIRWAQELVNLNGIQEEAHQRLIRLYVEQGRDAAALEQYRALEAALHQMLGMAPSLETQALLRDVPASVSPAPKRDYDARKQLRHAGDTGNDQGRPIGRYSVVVLPTSGAQPEPSKGPLPLPVPLTSLIGRERDVDRLGAILQPMPPGVHDPPARTGAAVDPLYARSRIVTLTGPGGCGKTRLAIAVAQRLAADFDGRVAFAEVGSVTNREQLLSACARAAGLQLPADADLRRHLAHGIGDRPFLLILDQFDKIVSEADMLPDLVHNTPGLRCIVTTRINIEGEQVYHVSPLAVPNHAEAPEALIGYNGVRLFVERAQAISPDFQVTTRNASAVASLCRHLDGLPLALELAASWIQTLSPQQMVARLPERFALLERRREYGDPRHWSLAAVLDESYSLLPEPLKKMFAAI